MKINIIMILIVFASVTTFSQVSKVGTTAADFLEIGPGAVATGMGGAFVSVANDASALYWNPSGIADFTKNEVTIFHANWIASTNFDYAALVLPLGEIGNIGFSFTSFTMADEMVRTVDLPEGTGEFFSAGDIAVALSYARKLTDRFSIGFTAKYIQESIWHESASAIAIDAGTIFRTDLFNGLTIGASLSNFGTQMKLYGSDIRTFNRVNPNLLGSNNQIPYDVELDSWDLPLLFQIGVSTNIIKNDDYRLLISVDALHPNNNYESMNIGGQFSFREFLFIRGGFRNLFLADSEGGLTLGIGVNSKLLFSDDFVSFDYAYRNFGRLDNVHTLSVDIKF
ncbi:MAG: PorV/PorQ family protein [Ignavibacteriaceae bacterium]|nr:PorV/PorQ family protein [Ignavibacteriaceae bacterium]